MRTSIEKLVRWAVVDEWPKGADGDGVGRGVAPGWGSVETYAKYLTLIDDNAYGVVPDPAASGDVHPDAEAVARALDLVAGAPLDVVEVEWLIGDLADPGGDVWKALLPAARDALDREAPMGADGLRRSARGVREIVVGCAILGAPETAGWGIAVTTKKHPNGAEVWRRRVRSPLAWDAAGDVIRWYEAEVDVVGRAATRPADSYRVMVLDRAEAVAALLERRVKAIVWRSALRAMADVLSEGLDGVLLRDHVVVEDGMSALPWLGLGRQAGRVLGDVAATVEELRDRGKVRKKSAKGAVGVGRRRVT